MPNFCQLGNRQAVYKCNIQQTGRGGEKITPEITLRERLIMARCSLCATISHCHAECCQPCSSFQAQNKRAFKPFFFFWLEFLKGHLSALKYQPVHEDHVFSVENVVTSSKHYGPDTAH